MEGKEKMKRYESEDRPKKASDEIEESLLLPRATKQSESGDG